MMGRCGHYACSNPAAIKYYIDKGIEVGNEWRAFPAFAAWALSHGYSDDLTIDRIDSDRGYSPDNCRWVTMADNLRARKDRKLDMAKARQIRAMRAAGVSDEEVGRLFNIGRMHVYKVCAGLAWAE